MDKTKFTLEEIRSRMHTKQLYYADDPVLMDEQTKRLDKLFAFNNLPPSKWEEKQQLLKELFANIGKDCYIETPFHANWAGKHVTMGNGVYANFNLTLVDDGEIYIGNHVMFAPNVVLTTGTHPIHPELRKKQAQYNASIYIEDNVWIGSNAVVLPGVRIGENSVIGAGSVVTKDIPANVVAVGCPCNVLREITQHDREYFDKDQLIDIY